MTNTNEHVTKLHAEWMAARAEYLKNPTWETFCAYSETHEKYKAAQLQGEHHV